jgi:hypothetical protein
MPPQQPLLGRVQGAGKLTQKPGAPDDAMLDVVNALLPHTHGFSQFGLAYSE